MIVGLGQITKDHLTSGIPIISNIPVLRRLFTRDQKNHNKTNLIILLKPTILIREEHEENLLSSLSNKKNNMIRTNIKNQ
ncbi:MAG: type II and III secretion system protein [Candidatus Brocadia sp.]|nr:MAG: type II and III secretion system protein [Candidatus Brocadia sp.]